MQENTRRNFLQNAAQGIIDTAKILEVSYSKGNRGQHPDAEPPRTAADFLELKDESDALDAMLVGTVGELGITPEQFMQNKPVWLGDPPEITDISYEENCEVLVIGSGQAGTTATLRCAELGLDVLCLEVQTWQEYDNYACDMATYNSKYFLENGVPEYDLMEVFNEYMRKALGHAHPQIVKDYATRSGEMLDWMLKFIPEEYIEQFAHIHNRKGNKLFPGESCGQKSFIGMLQWRDRDTNINMWPFVIRSLHTAAERLGARHKYGAQAIRFIQGADGAIKACIANDIDGKYFRINCKAAIVCAGDFGGNPDMRIDLCDQLRNLAWSIGQDRTKASSIASGGRDGSGIRMCLWAGATMEPGPRAGQGANINEKPAFGFGGCWPCFGPDGKRFMNETLIKFGANGAIDMVEPSGILAIVTDSNWDEYCEHQGYGHEVMDRSNDYMLKTVRDNMANYKIGPEGFQVMNFARYGLSYDTAYAANTIEELGGYLGYTGKALANFVAEVAHWNEMCEAGKDADWGCDPNYMFPIKDGPFFGAATVLGNNVPAGGLCQHAGVCTNGGYNVLKADKTPIPGLYAAGNACGQRFGVQYHTPSAGNSCGSALTTGYIAAEHVAAGIK